MSSSNEIAFEEALGDLGCMERTQLVLQAISSTAIPPNKLSALAAAMCETYMPATSNDGPPVNTALLLSSAYLVFFMQAGFAMVCAGSVRTKNTMNILLKNLLDACAGAIAFYLVGYAFAYGDGNDNAFIGTSNFALGNIGLDDGRGWSLFLFNWAFSAAAATIVSGSVAERTVFNAYLAYSVLLTAFVYPVVVHWIWDEQGWLSAYKSSPLLGVGMIDFAGSGVVHMVGGISGLMGAMAVGPRIGRFNADGKPVSIPGHSATMVTLGTFILWFGWYGFNPGSRLAIGGTEDAAIAARTAVATTLSAASAGVFSLLLIKVQHGMWELLAVCNGLLSGLVAVTASCSVIQPWAAILCGMGAAFVYNYADKLCVRLKIDDPVAASALHGGAGLWGVLFAGLLAHQPFVRQVYGATLADGYGQGVLYGGNGRLLACQAIGAGAIIVWVGAFMFTFFFSLKRAGVLRVHQDEELAGPDTSKHEVIAHGYGNLYPASHNVVSLNGGTPEQSSGAAPRDSFGMQYDKRPPTMQNGY